MPPGPTSVTSRRSASNWATCAVSCCRPTSSVSGTGSGRRRLPFCVSKDFRRRLGESRYADVGEAEARARAAEERRLMPYVTLGLIRGLVRMSVEHGVRHWAIVVEPPLLRLLKTLGFVFQEIGPLVEHHGVRQPCHSDLKQLLEGVRRLRPDVWEVVTDRGRLWRALFEPQLVAA
jgi:N-acyl amino acid synthase of PEP-CTERM/exosortase system